MTSRLFLFLIVLILMVSYASQWSAGSHESDDHGQDDHTHAYGSDSPVDVLHYEQEVHLKNIRQLTFGGDNAEAYWSTDGKALVYQYRNKTEGMDCDQIYWAEVPAPGHDFVPHRVSNGMGRTTCAYFLPGNEEIVFASTSPAVDTCIQDPGEAARTS